MWFFLSMHHRGNLRACLLHKRDHQLLGIGEPGLEDMLSYLGPNLPLRIRYPSLMYVGEHCFFSHLDGMDLGAKRII